MVESGEMSKARDDWSLMMLGTGKYTSRQIYGPMTPELQKSSDEYVFKGRGAGHRQTSNPWGQVLYFNITEWLKYKT